MTETQLKQRLSAGVEDIDAPSDLLDRARLGGARRLRRRRITALAASSLAVAAIAGATFAVPAVRDRADQAPVATPTPWKDPITPNPLDRYARLMTKETGGDLAGDSTYLAQVLATWHDTQRKERGKLIDPVAGDVWANLREEPRIYWAGKTPAGRVALVVQHYQGRLPDPAATSSVKRPPAPTAQSTPRGIGTVVAMVRDDDQGRPKVREFVTPYDDFAFPYFTIRDPGQADAYFVAVGMGKRLGWGLSRAELTPMVFQDGVAVTKIPADVIGRMYVGPLPAR
ncbi:hypothetical protein EV651_103565 [Kribbella sp. VKM Ac-2571]|uniref:hypothetical protein n=1 Tax=Kribbella sp. VKM Ac-2571 TaxID=2512222 RepID=UPI0010608F54|nr:hypothetical protein [Kribbella sp. VKM Ac-2571]TDO67652.1 hypothetical protein EV651_103565 [Kribbella sp. VKM Ac-2571]